ncbi:hypothetical protein ACIP79_15620 [Streptomyces sp. NPDC088747]|uniref:hypothetical protein n=1 Tax=Streptomyces sp. NPDC088747 TaxID=3365886 RepID=UPI0038162B27
MAYVLEAVVARDELLRAVSRELAESGAGVGTVAAVVPLAQGLALMPMTDRLFDAVTDGGDGARDGHSGAEGSLGFWRLPKGFDGRLARWSAVGPVAYVEAEYFGGVGEQRAVVWADGAVALGPLHKPEDRPWSSAGSPLSQALRRLGAVAGAIGDEFQAVGLDRHRDTGDWLRLADDSP